MAAALLLAAGALGCGGKEAEKEPEEGRVEETGRELSKNPLEAMRQLGRAAEKAGEQFQKAAERAPVEPVKFDVLLPFLPEVEGWEAGEPRGSTTAMGEWKVTEVSRSYTRPGEPPASVELQITDGGFVPAVYAPFHMMSQFSTESTEGYQKGIQVGSYPGFESWQKASGSAELWVLVADRFLLHLRGGGVEAKELRGWVERLDLGRLASLGARP